MAPIVLITDANQLLISFDDVYCVKKQIHIYAPRHTLYPVLAIAQALIACVAVGAVQAAETIRIEAEDGLLSPSGFQVGNDPEASQGQYVYCTANEKGWVWIPFTTTEGGDFVVWAMAAAGAPNPDAHNSFYVSVDASSRDVWDVHYDLPGGPATNWQHDLVSARCGGNSTNDLCDPWTISLTPGSHMLQIEGRESLTRLDYLLITNDPDFDPTVVPPPPTETVLIEAEDGMLSPSGMRIESDPFASEGKYIYCTEDDAGWAWFPFTTSHGGEFRIWASAAAGANDPDAHNSFRVSIDASSYDVWDIHHDLPGGPATDWQYDLVSTPSSDPWTLTLAPGSHMLRIEGLESLARIDHFIITSDPDFEPEPIPPRPSETLLIEAEDGMLSPSGMQIADDPDASQGQYIYSTADEAGWAWIPFTVTHGGEFVIWAVAAAGAPDPTAHNSFYVSIDASPYDVWDIHDDLSGGPATGWRHDLIGTRCGGSTNSLCDPWTITLTPGSHMLRIQGRESLARIDYFIITSDPDFDPSFSANGLRVTLNWSPPATNEDGSPLTDLAGHKMYGGTLSGQYDTMIDVGNTNSGTFTDLTAGPTYYFAVTAYDLAGNESDFSQEISWRYDDGDFDGIPDRWESFHAGGDDMEPEGDDDQDGMSNLEEYVAGTDPWDARSLLKIDIQQTNGQLAVTFPARAARGFGYEGRERVFAVEGQSDWSGNWTALVGADSSPMTWIGDDQIVEAELADPDDSDTGFYRLNVSLEYGP